MAETSPARRGPSTSGARVEHRISVPPEIAMVALLGLRDEVLRSIEDGFPAVDIHVRGNEITLTGPAGDVALASRASSTSWSRSPASGTPLTADVVTPLDRHADRGDDRPGRPTS